MLSEEFLGEWKLKSSENFEALMKELEVSPFLRVMGHKIKPKIRIEKLANDEWKFTTKIPIRTHALKFKLGEIFHEEELFEGRKIKLLFTVDGDKFIQKYLDDNGATLCVVTREITSKGHMKTVSSNQLSFYNI